MELGHEIGQRILVWNLGMAFKYGTWAQNLGMELEHGINLVMIFRYETWASWNLDKEFRYGTWTQNLDKDFRYGTWA